VSSLAWNACPVCGGLGVQFGWITQRYLYDAGEADRWDQLCKLAKSGKYRPQNGLLVQLSDTVWESRKANRLVLEHELYASFVFLLLRARKHHSLRAVVWLDASQKHALLPIWEIREASDGRKLFNLHCRVDRDVVDQLLYRLQVPVHGDGLFRRPKLR
ncbi:hypothetical protein ACFOFO_00165, partial [Undibacterium arcticum]